jgi:hypothetical protein
MSGMLNRLARVEVRTTAMRTTAARTYKGVSLG